MAITLEQVEKLRERANVSYENAKNALEQNHGDLLEALIYLERQGRTKPEEGGTGGFFTTQPGAEQPPTAKLPVTSPPPRAGYRKTSGYADRSGFWDQLRELLRAGANILRHITVNQFEVWRGGQMMTTLPVLILVVMAIFACWITIPLIITGLFFGCRYRFSGPDLGKDTINNAMGTVSDTVDDMVNHMKDEFFHNGGERKGKK